ncbi:MAG: hypothetical protein HYX67_01425 [Candidatus Melainabacteria bacterium]|nr:hypothetical protein [Candidatus Melainabacteria bacterium]
MTMQATTSADSDQGYILPPNKTEYDRVKVQMIVGVLLILIVCFLNYYPSLKLGLLLDDFNNVDYVFRAWHGDSADFLANFYSNWAKLDVMKAYRPFISLSFFTDYGLFGLNYIGYHVTNVIMFAICSIFVSLITLELTGMYGNRSRASAAIWAGLLFAADPLHVESVSWIIGRVDLLCSVFYFASIFCFMRFRLLRERMYLIASLICMFIALGSKEMAVTVPLIQTMVCFLPIGEPKNSNRSWSQKLIQSDLKFAMLFWVELVGFYFMRKAFLGSDIGGYGNTDWKTVLNSWRNFADRPSIAKIFLPINEELQFPALFLKTCWAGFGMIFAGSALRLFSSRKILLPFIFLFLWATLAVLPTFQIWHIYPNLVGSRLFFTSSAPFCIALALCALPATDALGRFATKLWTYFGVTALTIIFICWSFILQENLKPWLIASSQMKNFTRQLTRFAEELKPGERVLLLNLPPDYQGAGMVTRSWYVEQICRPPFAKSDTSDRFISIEPVVSGSHDYLWPTELTNLLEDKKVAKKVIWNSVKGEFEEFQKHPASAPNVTANNFLGATIEPASAWTGIDKEWRLQSDRQPGMEIHSEFRRLYPATRALKKGAPQVMTFWLPVKDINPLAQNYARLNISVHGNSSDLDRCRFMWKSKGLNLPGQIDHEAMIQRDQNDKYFVWLGRYRGWSLNDPPTAVGLRMPSGDYCIDLKSIELVSDVSYKPSITIDNERTTYGTPGPVVLPKSENVQIHWQAKMPGVTSVILRVSKPNLVFDPNSELDVASGPSGNLAKEIPQNSLEGALPISELKLLEGTTQVQVVGKDKNGDQVGLPSEPISIKR